MTSVTKRKVATMIRDGDDLDVMQIQEAILQKEEEMKTWCPSSGENMGRVIEFPGNDEWYIQCPTCGMKWAGGSTVLADHNTPGRR